MAVSRKGFLFTVIALFIVSLVVYSYMIADRYTISEKHDSIRTRIMATDTLLKDIKSDMSRALYISGFRSLLTIIEMETSSGNYYPVSPIISQLALTGRVNNQTMPLLVNATVTDWVSNVAREAAKMSYNVSITVHNLSIYQTDPWYVTIAANVTAVVFDSYSYFNNTDMIYSDISIMGFEDPMYAISTGGLVTNLVRKTNISDFVNGSDVSGLADHVGNGYYIAGNGPSFLDRLQGLNVQSAYGIESLVDVSKIISSGIQPRNASVVDHIYFSGSNPQSWQVQGMPDWFRMDNQSNRLQVYDIRGVLR